MFSLMSNNTIVVTYINKAGDCGACVLLSVSKSGPRMDEPSFHGADHWVQGSTLEKATSWPINSAAKIKL